MAINNFVLRFDCSERVGWGGWHACCCLGAELFSSWVQHIQLPTAAYVKIIRIIFGAFSAAATLTAVVSPSCIPPPVWGQYMGCGLACKETLKYITVTRSWPKSKLENNKVPAIFSAT